MKLTLLLGNKNALGEYSYTNVNRRDTNQVPLNMIVDGMENDGIYTTSELELRRILERSYDRESNSYNIFVADLMYDDNFSYSDSNESLIVKLEQLTGHRMFKGDVQDYNSSMSMKELFEKYCVSSISVTRDVRLPIYGRHTLLNISFDGDIQGKLVPFSHGVTGNSFETFRTAYMDNLVDFLKAIQSSLIA